MRRQLVEELGLEPGPALREMQQRILRQDATLNPVLPPEPAEPARPERRRRRTRIVAAAAALTLAAFAGAAVLALRGGDDDEAVAVAAGEPALVTVDAGKAGGAAALPGVAARMTTGLGARWVTSPDDGTLLRLDRSGVVTQTIEVGHGPVGVTTARGDVWVAAARDGQVVRVDTPTSRVVQRIRRGRQPV